MNNNWLTIKRDGERVILKKCSQEAEGKVIIPDGVTEIGESAFEGCEKVNEVYIPNGVKSIGKDAFIYCDLTSIHIPASVTNIDSIIFEDHFEQSPFYGNCHIASISVDKENPIYDSRDNCNAIIKTSDNRIILGCQNTYIPDSVSIIGNGAFFFFDTPFKIPKGVKVIEPYAFYHCSFKFINIANSNAKLKDTSFRQNTRVMRDGNIIKREKENDYRVVDQGLSGINFRPNIIRKYYLTQFNDHLKSYFCCREDKGTYILIERIDDGNNRRLADETPGDNINEKFMFASTLLYMIIAQKSIGKIAPEAKEDFHKCMGWPMIQTEPGNNITQQPMEVLKLAGLSLRKYEIPLFLQFVYNAFWFFREEMNALLNGRKGVMKDLAAGERFVKIVKGHKGSRIKKYLTKQENTILQQLRTT